MTDVSRSVSVMKHKNRAMRNGSFWREIRKTQPFKPRGGLGIFTDRDQRSIVLSFKFRKSVFFWVLLTAAVFFGLLDKCCILSVSYFNIIFWAQFIHPVLK